MEMQDNKTEKKINFKEKSKLLLKKEIDEIKGNIWKSIGIFILEIVKIVLIMILLIYFLSRPYTCETVYGKEIHFEEFKFNYYSINETTCNYNIIKDFNNFYKAYNYKINTYDNEKNIEEEEWKQINPTQILNQ